MDRYKDFANRVNSLLKNVKSEIRTDPRDLENYEDGENVNGQGNGGGYRKFTERLNLVGRKKLDCSERDEHDENSPKNFISFNNCAIKVQRRTSLASGIVFTIAIP